MQKAKIKKTIKVYANAIHEFEKTTNFKDFKTFNTKQAVDFKEYLTTKKNKRTGKAISKSYLRCATYSKIFFEFLLKQKGYSKYINANDIEYFSLTRNDKNKTLSTDYQRSYEINEILSTIRNMSNSTPIEMRDKAMISLNLLVVPRISALQSATIESIKYFKNQDSLAFYQNSSSINTKFSKQITSYFIGNLQDIYKNVFDWIDYLKSKSLNDKD
jgi:site-specific recombinase XerD